MSKSWRTWIILVFMLALCIPAICSAESSGDDTTVVYSSDFSTDPGWSTNSQSAYYWDNATQRYHYLMEGATNGYAGITLPNPVTGSFTLEFDVTPIKTDPESVFRFGIGNEKRSSQSGPLVSAELNNKKNGKLFYLTTITKENLISTVGSSPVSGKYEGSTVHFEDGKTYHVKISYYDDEKRASITVREGNSDAILFGYYILVNGKMEEFTDLFLTSIGEGSMGPKAEGYIDNVTLSTPLVSAPPPEDTPAPTPTKVVELAQKLKNTPEPTLEPVQKRTALPTPPPVTTTKSGSLPLVVIPGIAGAVWLVKRR